MKKVKQRLLIDTSALVLKKQMPFMAFIIGDDGLACSGTIPSLTTVLTTAQCITGDKKMMAWAGTNRLRKRPDFAPPTQHRSIAKIAVPDEYYVEIDDIGVAFLRVPWNQDDYVKPTQIWIQNKLLPFDFNVPLQVVGWGYGNQTGLDRYLRQTVMFVGSSMICPTTALQHLRQLMCSMDILHKTICKGDHGGAVVFEFPTLGHVQLGVIKSQEPTQGQARRERKAVFDPDRSDESCQVPALANLFMYTGYYRKWILETISDLPTLEKDWPTPNFTRPSPYGTAQGDLQLLQQEMYGEVAAVEVDSDEQDLYAGDDEDYAHDYSGP
ncbi:transmembrane protease serine 4-like [Schistocerca gregaria]|uniref:transmembrane protease serine 4-like n=1 Tax=Schistocerca gregaria TaxID=7010 RepID=UPI00211E09EC|nr:transmembrane protease serine 4-like [Schistocerca gregaria]